MNSGGINNQGLIYRLTPGPSLPWKYTQIHRFAGGSDGNFPAGAPILDALDNVFGATRFGGVGSPGDGTVYEISPVVGGGFTYSVLYRFSGPDGSQPLGNLIQDGQGKLYGTTIVGGTFSNGTVFELSPIGGGVWNEAVLYSFAGGADGSAPVGGVAMDSLGNLYGTTTTGGGLGSCQNFCGTVFKLTPSGNSWTETILHSFSGPDGASPSGNVTLDAAGNLYSTTADGGQFNKGTVFEVTP